MNDTAKPCPRQCGRDVIPATAALSRADNTTRVCGPCGTSEAMWDHTHPGATMAPADRPLAWEAVR